MEFFAKNKKRDVPKQAWKGKEYLDKVEDRKGSETYTKNRLLTNIHPCQWRIHDLVHTKHENRGYYLKKQTSRT